MLIEIRFHGRGGQGAKTAADLLALTALESGKHIQSFPEYGPERAGAPIKSFTRISDEPINLHCGVKDPQIVCVIDPTLLGQVDVTEGLGENEILVVNTPEESSEVRKKTGYKEGKVFTVDATKIALEIIGSPLPNTPMLGALIKATELVNLDDLKKQVEKKLLKKIGQKKVNQNFQAIQKAYEEVQSG